jgi:hypothetical protein
MSKKPNSKGKTNPAWYSKGQTGNAGGRPRKSNATLPSTFDIVYDKTVFETRDGIAREIGLEEALQQRTYQDALAGNAMAQRQVVKWIMKHDAWNEKHARKPSHPIATRRITLDPDNADTALVLLGIAAPNPKRAAFGDRRTPLLLEPWPVQLALSARRGGQRLTESERHAIRRCTRDANSLRWPRGTDE